MPRRREMLLFALASSCYLIYYLNKRKAKNKRKVWVKSWLLDKESKSILGLLNKELKVNDPAAYRNFLRLNETQLEYLLNLIEKDIKKENTLMRECIDSRFRLYVTLRYLATGETYRSLMYSTRIHESTISKIIPETCLAIFKNLKGLFLKTPTSPEEWLTIAKGYEDHWNFPNCVGALDGRHISFSAPISSGSYYHNYKGGDSIVLLGLVDAHYRFIYVNVGVNGRSSDGGVFSRCKLAQKMRDNSLGLPNHKALPGTTTKVSYVIIADDAFPLMENLMKPHSQRNLTYEKRIYNYRLSRARRMVECAFGILANRWRVLLNKIHLSAEKVELITLTCVVLHNFLMDDNCNPIENESDGSSIQSLLQVTQQTGNRPATSATTVRETFTNYFNSPAGSIAWQDDAVNRGG